MATTKIAFTIVGNPDVLTNLNTKAAAGTFDCSVPVAYQSPADALDAPLNPQDVVEFAKAVKVIFEAGTAGVAFIGALLGALRMWPNAKVQVRDARTNRSLGSVDGSMTEQQVKDTLGISSP